MATRRRAPGDVVGLSEQRSEDAHDAQEDDDPDDDDGDQKEDQEPKATAVTLSHYDHLWRWWGCLAHSGVSLGVYYRLACHLILADRHLGQKRGFRP